MEIEKSHRPERELAEREPAARTEQAAGGGSADNASAAGEARMWNQIAAARGTSGSSQQLPHLAQIQRSFGHHDVSRVRAHVGGPAAAASRELGARAYAHGNSVAFADAPDLHTAAHEAAHVVQQQSGVALKAIDGGAGDAHEQHADRVADAVVRGESAQALLDPVAGRGGGAAVQRKTDPSTGGAALTPPTWEYCNTHRIHIIARLADRIRSVGLPKPHPRLYWAIRENAEQAFIDVIAKDIEVMQTQTLHRLMEFSYPADLYAIVDGVRRGGTPSQLREWHDVVGIAIANAMSEPLDASIQRMAMRLRVQLDGPARGDVHNAQLVPSCPLDVLVSEAFKKVGVIGFVGGAEHKSSVDDTPGKPFAHGTNPVQFEYAGKRDPKLWNWIEVTSPKNATAEDVAATQLDKTREDSVMGPQQAYRITASHPYFGIPIEVARRVPAMRDFASAKDEEDASTGNFGRVADARALHDSSVSDEVAVKQAPPAGPHTESLDRLLGRVEPQIAAIAERLERVKAGALIAGAKHFIERCRDKLAINPKEASRFVPAVAAQESILHEVSSELVEIFRSLDQRKAKSIPPSVADVIRAYARAAGASHLAAEASTLIVEARTQKALLPLAILDDEVRSARDNIGDHGDMTEKGAEEQTAALPGMMTQAADMRLRVARGEKVTGTEISQATADANELDTRARLTNLASTVRALQTAADSVGLATGKMPGGFWSVSLATQMILDLIEKPEKSHAQYEGADKLHGGWLERLDLAKKNGAKPGHDPSTEMQASVKYVNGELAMMDSQLGGMKTFIKWCNEQREYQALKNLLTSMAWQIGLMIVTGEIAGAGLAAVRGIALAGEIAEDVRGASLLWRGAEVVVHAGLQTVASGATGGDISASAFAENALGMLLSSAAMKPFKALLEEDAALERNVEQQLSKLAKTGKFVKAGFKVGADVAIDLSGGVVGAGMAHAIVNNADAGITSRDAWMTQSLALTASAVVHAHTAPLHARLARAVESMRAAKMQDLAAQLDALAARAETLEAKSSPRKGITPDEAGAMLAERHQILAQERALYQQAGKGDLAKPSAKDLAAGGEMVDVQLQLAGVSSVIDGLAYEGTGKQIESALKKLSSEAVATRDEKGVWTIVSGEQKLTVKELDFEPSKSARPKDSAAKGRNPERVGESRAAEAVPGSNFTAEAAPGEARAAFTLEDLNRAANAAVTILGGAKGGDFAVMPDGRAVLLNVARKWVRIDLAIGEPGETRTAVAIHTYEKGSTRAHIIVAEHARPQDLARAVAHELAEIHSLVAEDRRSTTDPAALKPGSTSEDLNHHDLGRKAELQILMYELKNDPSRGSDITHEIRALITDLGFDFESLSRNERARKVLGNDTVKALAELTSRTRVAVDINSGEVKPAAKIRGGKEWVFTLDVVLPNGQEEHIGDGHVSLDANGRPQSGPDFYLDKRVDADGVPSRVDFVRDGKPVPFTEYAITEASRLFERDFGHPPTELPGSLADDNREIFQRAYLAAIDGGMPADKAAEHAAENTPFVKNRRRLGFTDVRVTPSRTMDTIVYGLPPRLRKVPHGADIVARKP